MKQTLRTLLLVVLSFCLASCSATRKSTKEKEQHESSTSVTTKQQSLAVKSDVQTKLTTDIDNSTIVIEFVKNEYTDDTTKHDNGDAAGCFGLKKNVKSVTSGRVTINNDKKRQEGINSQYREMTQTTEISNAEVTEIDKSYHEEKTEKPNYGWLKNLIVIAMIALGVTLALKYRK